MPRSLRLDGETDEQFRERADRAGKYAKLLVDACLRNECVRQYIADPALPYSAESLRQCPVVRVEFEEAIAIGGIGETLDATRSKHWGEGPQIMPLAPGDWFYAERGVAILTGAIYVE